MPKEVKKGKKVSGKRTTRNNTRKGDNQSTTTESSETPKEVMLAEMRAAG